MGQEYYLGLDMGTNSVGWAVTDKEYHVIRKSGKDLWGIREFDEAVTSVDRRQKRANRRRLQREIVRCGLLKEYFDDEIAQVDPLFFMRLNNSKFFAEDKDARLKSVNAIFDDEDYKDSDYYHTYPTIFHLRKALIEDSVPHDKRYSRLVYLALLNAFKHRGHFLNEGLSSDGESVNTVELFVQLEVLVTDRFGINLSGYKDELAAVLADRMLSKMQKVERMISVLNSSDKRVKEILKGICGLKFDIKKIYDELESEEKLSYVFSDASYEENIDSIIQIIGQECFDLIELMKQIYDAGLLSNILKGEKYISFACVKAYKKHAEDLDKLKRLYKKFGSQEEYDFMFRMDVVGSYSAYIGTNLNEKFTSGKASRRNADGRKRDDLYKNIKKFLSNIDDPTVKDILSDIDNGEFLPKLRGSDNGVIPNQVHLREVRAILNNAEKYLKFLSNQNEYKLTVSEQIQQLFAFRIPYYIGPVSENSKKNQGNGWVVRKAPGPVFPWNINDKIDIDQTQEAFIKNLIRECTYISGEKVIPKSSLLYESYCVLNEINNIRIDGERINVELKQDIYNELFKKKNRVSRKNICKYLVSRGVITSDSQITGIDISINNALTSYNRFKSVFGDDIDSEPCQKMCERIVELGTIFGESKKTFAEALSKEFGTELTGKQIKIIQGFKFRDWGRMSKELFFLQGQNPENGEKLSLIRALWETNYNFMELINSDEFMYKASLQEKQKKLVGTLSDFTADDLKDFYFSAPVRRMIWQTILIIKEVSKIMGDEPARVFIEMTRTEDKKGDKGRNNSRGRMLETLYSNIKDNSRAWVSEIKAADADGLLRSKKLYLYYLQMGKCLYTGETIELDELMKANSEYDIDHIYPRHYVKDDNIQNNLVLVKKTCNAYKSDEYPLKKMSPEVYNLWKTLHANKLMSDEKYKRLTSREPFTEEQLAGFIARQLVETSQGTKGVADILKMVLPKDKTKIVYAKGGNVSDFRNQFNILKSRSLNDFHHAKDAYLNIVVGNAYYTKFTQNPRNFISREYKNDVKKYHYNLGKMFEWDIERDGEKAWIAEHDGVPGTIALVKSVMEKNTPMISRLVFEAKGALSKETLYGAKNTDEKTYIPFKTKDARFADIKKYGGFTGVNGAYFFIVEHTVKNKRVRTLENMPIYKSAEIKNTKDLCEYCMKEMKLVEPRVCVEKIRMQTLIIIDGFKYRLSGRTGNQIILRNEISLCLNQNWTNYIHCVDKFIENGNLSKEITSEKNMELYEILTDKHCTKIFNKRKNPVGKVLADGRNRFKALSIKEQCELINEVLKLSAIGPTGANLTVIGGAARSGVMLCSKDFTKAESVIMINQSATGFYEKEIDLLSV